MRWLLGILSYLAFWIALPFLLTHQKLRDGVRARLGLYEEGWPGLDGKGPRIWLHGASAGDLLALMPLVERLHRSRDDLQIVVSTITNSGRAIAEREQASFAAITYLPYDLPGSVRRALRRIRPDVLVLEYTELWPQLIHAAARQKVPVVLHNGRFSADKLGRYRALFVLTGNLLRHMAALLMRDEHEAERALALGAPPNRVFVTGNTKFDGLRVDLPHEQVETLRAAAAFDDDHVVWVMGSTHEGEEDLLLDVFVELRRDFPNLRAIIAPRYTDRADRIRSLAMRRDLRSRLRSEGGDDAVDVFILNTIGELAACYAIADLVFVGGSFVARGGQNILEPAVCGKPVLFGPHMDNFADSVQVLLGRGGIQAAHPSQLTRVMRQLLEHPENRQELGEMARQRVTAIRGAATRNAERILALLPQTEALTAASE